METLKIPLHRKNEKVENITRSIETSKKAVEEGGSHEAGGGKMKVLVPFWDLTIFDRFFPQMKSIKAHLDELHVAYHRGTVRSEWKKHFVFHRFLLITDKVTSTTVRWFLSKNKIFKQLKHISVDLYYCLSGFWNQQLAHHFAGHSGKPYVVRLRGDHRAMRDALKISFWKKCFFNYFETKTLREATLIIPVSLSLLKKSGEWAIPSEKITRPVPNGVDADMFKPKRVTRYSPRFTVGYAGRISPEKRVDKLVEVARKMPDIQFVLAGKWQLAGKLRFPENVLYLGEFSFENMPNFYSQIDLLVLPSLTEGFPSVILEAYACERPVIATKQAFPEELEKFGGVIRSFSQLPVQIRQLQRSDLNFIGKQARAYVQNHYTWHRFGERIAKAFEHAVQNA